MNVEEKTEKTKDDRAEEEQTTNSVYGINFIHSSD